VADDAVRADRLVPVHGQVVSRCSQGHGLHGGADISGRNSWRRHSGSFEQCVLPTALRRYSAGSRGRTHGLVPSSEHRVRRGVGGVRPCSRLDPRISLLSFERKPRAGGGQVSPVVEVRRRSRRQR